MHFFLRTHWYSFFVAKLLNNATYKNRNIEIHNLIMYNKQDPAETLKLLIFFYDSSDDVVESCEGEGAKKKWWQLVGIVPSAPSASTLLLLHTRKNTLIFISLWKLQFKWQ